MRENVDKKPYNEKVGAWLRFLKDLRYYFHCEGPNVISLRVTQFYKRADLLCRKSIPRFPSRNLIVKAVRLVFFSIFYYFNNKLLKYVTFLALLGMS